jgi:catechol 2,3-dioxygenase-like lactoylglutathione lyase family enzyme
VSLPLRFHHLGLATARPKAAAAMLGTLGYTLGDAVWDPEQRVHVQMGEHPAMPAVELVFPGDEPGPIDALLKRAGPGPYHLCFQVDDIEAARDQLDEAGHRVLPVVPPTPAILFGGRRVAFFQVHGFGLIELVEVSPR